jgi:branched-chain amino acid transport system ATP-binding protein
VTLLAARSVSIRFGGLQALRNVSLNVESGERHAIIGPNGAGKTTLFNLFAGQLRPDAGAIEFMGQDISRRRADERTRLGLARTFQITNLFPSLTVFENVVLAVQGLDPTPVSLVRPPLGQPRVAHRARDILQAWELWDRRDEQVRNLSYGDQRQLEVVLALASRPRLLLLDEPTAGLSPAETASMTATLARLERDITLLLIEHDIDFVFNLAERVTLLHLGEVLASGTADEVRGNPRVHEIYLGEE